MGRVSGNKARYHRERRKKLARRVSMRALQATLENRAAATLQPKAQAATKPSAKTSASRPSA
jgi:hypothetical protein